MKRLAVIGILVGLSGCMTTDSVEKRPPVFSASTTKAPAVYAACVQEAWINLGGGDLINKGNSIRLRNIAGGIADITPTASGAEVVMREPPLSGFAMEKAARKCL